MIKNLIAFGLQDTRTNPRVYYMFLNVLILLGERILRYNWSEEFKNMARILNSLLEELDREPRFYLPAGSGASQ